METNRIRVLDSSPPSDPNLSDSDAEASGTVDRFARTVAVEEAVAHPSWDNLEVTRVIDPGTDSPELTPPAEVPVPVNKPTVGTTLGDFELLEKLGEGAMGAVYRARQISFDRVVALKILFSHIGSQPRLVERLYREGRALAQLDHDNIVQAYGIGEESGHHYVAMEFVDGKDLQAWLKHLRRFSVADALMITLAVARGLEHAHARGIVHRDVKPENILISTAGEIKLADLGMVKTADEDLTLTQTGHAIGTPWYMPLEQAKDAKSIDARSDIYALGCQLYCLLTGRPPFQGKTLVDLIQAKERGVFPTARSHNPEVPERLDLILLKMIAKNPAQRYQSVHEVIHDIERLDLAGRRLSFLTTNYTTDSQVEPRTPRADTVDEAPDFDPAVWYVKIPSSPGKHVIRRQSTEQVLGLLQSGKIKSTTPISHFNRTGFRSLSTWKEFQTAAGKATSRTDDTSARYRELYQQIDRQLDHEDSSPAAGDSIVHRSRFYVESALAYLIWPVGIALVLGFLWWVISGMFVS